MQISKIKDLTGHSGARISLFRNEVSGTFFCRKYSASPETNSRLRKQCAKQIYFGRSNAGWSTPKVLNFGYERGLFFFDMEYLQGNTLANKFALMDELLIKKWIDSFFDNCRYLTEVKKESAFLNPTCFKHKIFLLEEQIRHKYSGVSSLQNTLSLLYRYDFAYIPATPCHGDLTLENILINSTTDIFLIDFLDSFANTWYIDAAKILQDLEIGWSWRNKEIDMNRELRRVSGLKYFRGKLTQYGALTPVYYLLLLNLLRIVPYTNDLKTLKFLDVGMLKVTCFLETIQ